MSGIKIANENATNGVSGEPMGGMGGSYSNLARFPGTTNYVFAWQSRGSVNLTPDSWRGTGYTQSSPRWLNHNVAIATLSAKNKLTGSQAISTVGAAEGDLQVNWITKSSSDDHQNIHVAALNSKQSLVTWETLVSPTCKPVPLSCTGTYAGTSFQVIDSAGTKVGGVVTDKNVFVSGDIANVGTDRVCWPYVDITWDLSKPKSTGGQVTKLSFACASFREGGSITPAVPGTSSSAAAPSVTSSPVVASSSTLPISVAVPSTTALVSPGSTSNVGAVIPTTSVVTTAPALPTSAGAIIITTRSTTTLVTSTRTRPQFTASTAKYTTSRRTRTTRVQPVNTATDTTAVPVDTSAPVTTVVIPDCHSRRKKRHGHAKHHA
jgi:hypothetical protein